RGSRAPREGDRGGDDPLRRPGARRGRLDRPGHRDGQPRVLQARVRAAARTTRLVGRAVDAPVVGILALQGDFAAHARVLRALGAAPREVRVPADLDGLDGLVIPGGESTTMTLGIE